jgi:hypothetical protein
MTFSKATFYGHTPTPLLSHWCVRRHTCIDLPDCHLTRDTLSTARIRTHRRRRWSATRADTTQSLLQPTLAVPLKPLRITREPVNIKDEPEDEYTHHGIDQGGASWHACSPFQNHAPEEDGMSPSSARKRVRGSHASHLSDYDYTSSPTAAMRELTMVRAC